MNNSENNTVEKNKIKIKDINEENKPLNKYKILSISENNHFSIINYDNNYNEININSSININLSRNGSNNFYFSFKDGETNIKPLTNIIKKENFMNTNNNINNKSDDEIKNNNDIFF